MKKNTKSTNAQKNITILFGYGLFVLMVVSVIVSTIIPWTNLYFNPETIRLNHLNVAVLVVSLVVGAILPTLVAYIIGDQATHIKNKASHHYNGVLFGIAAYWLSSLFSLIGSYAITPIRENFSSVVFVAIVNAWPIVMTIIVMTTVAISYARHQKNKASVLQHLPYQWVLLGSVVASLIYPVVNQLLVDPSGLFGFTSPVATGAVIFISYLVLTKSQPSRRMRLLTAVVASTIGLATLLPISQLVSYLNGLDSNILFAIAAGLFSLFVWIAYLWLISRRSKLQRGSNLA